MKILEQTREELRLSWLHWRDYIIFLINVFIGWTRRGANVCFLEVSFGFRI